MTTLNILKELSWSEKQLPQKERTKHVHSIHQYIGKFVPQLVDYFLERDLQRSKLICDPFMGSGTTLVESNTYGISSIGLDISKFNVMLCNVKTKKYNISSLKKEITAILDETSLNLAKTTLDNFLTSKKKRRLQTNSKYLNMWYHKDALQSLLLFKDLIPKYKYQNVLKVILSRSARSSRMVAHYETDHPKKPQKDDYYCLKHDRMCHPTKNALLFLKRYCHDTVKRINEFQQLRNDVYTKAIYGDSRTFNFSNIKISDVFTSPPYIGLLDYHDQHRYAYELLGIQDNSNLEIGSKKKGSSKSAISNYKKSITKTLTNITESSFNKNGVCIIVVNDKLNLYQDIISDAGLKVQKLLHRHVNRRSGRRATDFNESIFVCKLNGI